MRLWDRLLGREMARVHDEFLEAMKPSEQVQVALADAIDAIKDARARQGRRPRYITPPPVPRPARIPSIPDDL